MAVFRTLALPDNWIGLSSDIKPTENIRIGTIFTELDTGVRYIFYNKTWEYELSWIYAIKEALKS